MYKHDPTLELNVRNQKICSEYKNGSSISDIAQSIGCSIGTIHRVLHKNKICRTVEEGLSLAKKKIYKKRPIARLLEDKEKLLKLYETNSLGQISSEFKCSRAVLSRELKKLGIKIKKWGNKSKEIQNKKREGLLPQQLLDKDWLTENYINQNKSLLDLAAELKCSMSPIRARLKRFGIPIRPPKRYDQGQKSSHSHGVMTKYKPIKCSKKEVTFRSLLELSYAMLLEKNEQVSEWDYEVMWTYYLDGFTGKQRKYICDFRITFKNNIEFDGDREYEQKVVEHVEVKPKSRQTFEDKYLYAQNTIPNWRFISDDEIAQCEEILKTTDLSRITIPLIFQPKSKKYVVWSKEDKIILPPNHRVFEKRRRGQFYSFRIINDELIEIKDNIVTVERPGNLHKSHWKDLELDLDKILNLIKQDKSAKEIGNAFGCYYRTVIKFLEDRSYVVYWSINSSRHNEIRHVTKKIWPPDDLLPRQADRDRMNYYWDNKDWLYEHYWVKGLSTRDIGKIVGKSNRLVRKKLVSYSIKLRSISEAVKLKAVI